MLEQRLEATEPTWQPAVALDCGRSELLNHQEVAALLSLLRAPAVPAFAVGPFFSAIWISFHHETAGALARFSRQSLGAVR